MRVSWILLMAFPVTVAGAQGSGFGVCKPVQQRTSEVGCWILTDQAVGRAAQSELYWHLDTYRDSGQAVRARDAHGVVIRALGKIWLMTIDGVASRVAVHGHHVTDIGPLKVKAGTEYAATFMEAVSTPGTNSAVHRHSGPEAWYTVAGETCLETPERKLVGRAGVPAIVPEGPPMRLTTTGTRTRRAITLILHDAARVPTQMESTWKPRGLCR